MTLYKNDDVQYAKNRLVETIVRYKERAVVVHNVWDGGESLRLSSSDCVTGDYIPDDGIDEFDLTPVPLGFVNRHKKTLYFSRKPMREDWRQGLRGQNIHILYGLEGDEGHMLNLDYKSVGQTINGEFPKIGETELRQGERVAWHRDFCYDGSAAIYYKWYGKVGNFISLNEKQFLLDAEYYWVEESLREALSN